MVITFDLRKMIPDGAGIIVVMGYRCGVCPFVRCVGDYVFIPLAVNAVRGPAQCLLYRGHKGNSDL